MWSLHQMSHGAVPPAEQLSEVLASSLSKASLSVVYPCSAS